MSIAEVIGWKFNHQEGMSTRDGVITEFPGGIPSQADQDKWTAEYEAYLPTKKWQEDMANSDSDLMPRWAEDIISKLGTTGIAPETVQKFNEKQSLRSQKPE